MFKMDMSKNRAQGHDLAIWMQVTKRKTKKGESACLWEQDLGSDNDGTGACCFCLFVFVVVVIVSLLVPLCLKIKI